MRPDAALDHRVATDDQVRKSALAGVTGLNRHRSGIVFGLDSVVQNDIQIPVAFSRTGIIEPGRIARLRAEGARSVIGVRSERVNARTSPSAQFTLRHHRGGARAQSQRHNRTHYPHKHRMLPQTLFLRRFHYAHP